MTNQLVTSKGKRTKIKSDDEIAWSKDGKVQILREGQPLRIVSGGKSVGSIILRQDHWFCRGVKRRIDQLEISELLACACGLQVALLGKSSSAGRMVFRFI